MSLITHALLKRIIADQKDSLNQTASYSRTAAKQLDNFGRTKEIVVVTGIRRCGKSSLLEAHRQNLTAADYTFNFEDERLANFTIDDFHILHEVFVELYGEQKYFFFDEIQNVTGWELFVRRLYNAGHKIFITGSNANLFSEELGTRLSGRYLSVTLYPFSFHEYAAHHLPDVLAQKNWGTVMIGQIRRLLSEYCVYGGIPEYTKHHIKEYLQSLYDSIIFRDIVARYRLPDGQKMRQLVYYLATNCSKEITYSSIKKFLGLKSATTVTDYCHYLEASYLCFFVYRYDESLKAQENSPKKVYFVDHAFARMVGFHFADDLGRMIENIVFVELKRRGFEIFYHRETKECDFVVRRNQQIVAVIQVCSEMSAAATRQREYLGMLDAMKRYQLNRGTIITMDEEGSEMLEDTYKVTIRPLYHFLLELEDPVHASGEEFF